MLVLVALALLYLEMFPPHLPIHSSKDTIPWQKNLPTALEQARASGRPVLLDFSAGWCTYCRRMEQSVWPDAKVGQTVKRDYIPVSLDVDDPAGGDAAKKYGVQFLPAIFVLDADGNVLREGSFMNVDEMNAFLKPGYRPELLGKETP